MSRKSAFWATLIALCLLLAGSALASEAQDVTVLCSFKGKSNSKWSQLYDRKFTTQWTGLKADNPSIELQLPEGQTCAGLYVCFHEIPESWCVQEWREGDEWETIAVGGTQYQHEYVAFEPQNRLRLRVEGRAQVIKLSELFVLTEGDAPAWVQRWEQPTDKVDLLVLAAHPDDELIYFGGTIPYYAAERGKRVQVAFATMGNATRRSEALNVLWMLGVRNYPLEGGFFDAYSSSLEKAYGRWPRKDVEAWLTEVVRKVKPEVMVTHDVNGEYGHGAHRLCADAARNVLRPAADASSYPESAEAFGAWQVKKLYLHLYDENQLTMDWKSPLGCNPDKTALGLAQEAFALYVTQQNSGTAVLKGETFAVNDGGEYDNALFGLAETTVGLDVLKTDFFENIDWQATAEQIAAAATPVPTPQATDAPLSTDEPEDELLAFLVEDEPSPTATPEQTPTPTQAPTPTPSPNPSATPAWTLVFPTPPPNSLEVLRSVVVSDDSNAEVIAAELAKAPAVNARGFLDEGEYAYENAELGLWVYRSATLSVTVERKSNSAEKRVWYEADLLCDVEAGELLHTVPSDADAIGTSRQQPETIAAVNKVVFGMSSDYFSYRVNRTLPVGIVIRGGQIIYDTTFDSDTKRFPNYDTLALYPDGTLQTNLSAEYSAEEYLANGAYDVLCFGPYLVRNGVLNPMLADWSLGQTNQPRCSLGMIEKGHYFAILEEGRMKDEAKGTSLSGLAAQMLAKGCVEALNLDGGQTAAMTFMGKRITRVGSYNNGNTSPRSTTEIIGLGTSQRVAP